MSKYDGCSTEDLGNEFSDRYKDMNGFRPRHVSFSNREQLIASLEGMDRDWDNQTSTESGRAYLRSQGYHLDYEYGDKLTYRGKLYRVSFLYLNDGKIEAYDLEPMYIVGAKTIKLSIRSLIAWANDERDRETAKRFGMTLEQYRSY